MAASSASSTGWCAACARAAIRSAWSPSPARNVRADAFYPWPGASSLSRSDTLANTWTLWRAVRAFRPDMIHSFSRLAYLPPLLRGSVPIVMTFQRDPTPRTVGLAVKLAAPEVLRFTGCSDYIAALRPARAAATGSGIPNFFEIDALKFSPTVARRRAALLPEPRREHQGRALGDRDRAPHRPSAGHCRQPRRVRRRGRLLAQRDRAVDRPRRHRVCRRRSTTRRRTRCWARRAPWSCPSSGTSRSASSSPRRWPAARR